MRSLACLTFVVATFCGAVSGPANAQCSGGNVAERAQASIDLPKDVHDVLMAVLSEGATGVSKVLAQGFSIINGMLFDVATMTLQPNFVPEERSGISFFKEAFEARRANDGEAVTSSYNQVLKSGQSMQSLSDLGFIDN